jgi:hypothetical protein
MAYSLPPAKPVPWETLEALARSDADFADADGQLHRLLDAIQASPDAPELRGDGVEALRPWLRELITRDPELLNALDEFDLHLTRIFVEAGLRAARYEWLAFVTGETYGRA